MYGTIARIKIDPTKIERFFTDRPTSDPQTEAMPNCVAKTPPIRNIPTQANGEVWNSCLLYTSRCV